tara:strand:- start:22202 stop:23359 length:1158 start_codon:yes stop_codon:yes gene_type:complete
MEITPQDLVDFVREQFQTKEFIPLHEPRFDADDKRYVSDCIESTFVSTVGEYVGEFENSLKEVVGVKNCVATVNGTAALHVALRVAGVGRDTEVLTQALTFVATCNAISYLGAAPVFIDINRASLSLCPKELRSFLENTVTIDSSTGLPINNSTGRVISACVPMHTFGHSQDIEEIVGVCREFAIPVVEDAAESLGSTINGKPLGSFGDLAITSFNGNKIVTTGGGGAIFSNNDEMMERVRHLSTTGKLTHPWEYRHDDVAYNYRMPNLNAALGCAQLRRLEPYLKSKRELADAYRGFFRSSQLEFVDEPLGCRANFWLNAFLCRDLVERNFFLKQCNAAGVMTRPVWELMSDLPMFSSAQATSDLSITRDIHSRLVNIPSSVRL